ncbi:MAG: hypothetical protein M1389_01320 [Chloroflexi bacterium]|nr:hypothetical protein [Chloroflexota bacterium]
MKILFAVAAWGLGHATRDLVLIKALLAAGHEVTVMSTHRALRLLRRELGDRCAFVDVPDIPIPLSRWPLWFYVRMSVALPLVFWTFWSEHRITTRLARAYRFDRIVSDTRYGVFMREIPSYFIVHSLRQIIPGRPRLLERAVERVQLWLLGGARKVLVPDQRENGLAGDLCHNLDCFRQDQYEYIGILSSVRKQPVETNVDYFVTVSGAEPQRSIFEELVLEQVRELEGKVVVALGKPDVPLAVSNGGNVAIHSFMDRAEQEEMLNRARMVVTRSGYTTLMELAELGKNALLVPTAGQSEQEYLGVYHESLGTMHTVVQSHLNLPKDVAVAEKYRGLSLAHPTRETTRRFLQILEG